MTTEQSSRARVAQWVREHIEGKDEVRVPDLVDAAIATFSKDRRFLTSLANETLREMVYRQAVQTLSTSRSFISAGDVALTREGIKERARKHSVFANWLEHAGDRHVRLMDMTREDLLIAANEREKRGSHEMQLAALWRTIANGLEGGQTVSSKYSAQDIEGMLGGLDHA